MAKCCGLCPSLEHGGGQWAAIGPSGHFPTLRARGSTPARPRLSDYSNSTAENLNGYEFANRTDGGTIGSNIDMYGFITDVNREVEANFVPVGGSFSYTPAADDGE